MAEKQYCGIGKEIKTKFGKMMKLSLTKEDLATLEKNLSNGWVNLDVCKRREPSGKGTTHYLVINDFKPEKKEEGGTKEDLPF